MVSNIRGVEIYLAKLVISSLLSFCNIVKGQANGVGNFEIKSKFR